MAPIFPFFPLLNGRFYSVPAPPLRISCVRDNQLIISSDFFLFCRDLSFTWRYWAWSWFVFKRLNFRRYHLNSPFADQEYKANKKSAFHLLKRKQNRWQSHLSGIFLWYQVKFSWRFSNVKKQCRNLVETFGKQKWLKTMLILVKYRDMVTDVKLW